MKNSKSKNCLSELEIRKLGHWKIGMKNYNSELDNLKWKTEMLIENCTTGNRSFEIVKIGHWKTEIGKMEIKTVNLN